MRDIDFDLLDQDDDFENPIYSLQEFAGAGELSYIQMKEILEELEAVPPPPILREGNHPLYRWSKAPLGTKGLTSIDVKWSGVIYHVGLSLFSHKDRPREESSLDISTEEILEEEDRRLRAQWEKSDWIPFLDCSNTKALAYLRHLATTKELVWSKDSYKTTYFMLTVGDSFGDTLPDLPVSHNGLISISTSKFNVDPKDPDNFEVLKKLRVALKKMSLTQFSKTFLGEDFINIVDNTSAARPPIMQILNYPESKLILEMKLNQFKKTVFFTPIGVAYKA